MPSFLEGFAGGFLPSFQSSGQNFLASRERSADRKRQAEQDAIRNRLVEAQIASAEQGQRFALEDRELAAADREREQANNLNALGAEAGQIVNTANLLDALAESGQVSGEQVAALETLPVEQRGAALMELTGLLKPGPSQADLLEQQKIQADIDLKRANTDKARRGPEAPETFELVKGSDLNPDLAGTPDGDKMFNVSSRGKVTAAGGGGVTVNTGETGLKAPTGFMVAEDGKSVVPIPGGPQDPNTPTSQQRNDSSKAKVAFEAVDNSLGRLEDLVTEHGAEIAPGKVKDEMQQLQKTALLELKELFNLGVLNGPDLDILESLLVSPTPEGMGTVGAAIREAGALFGGGDPLAERSLTSIQRLRESTKQRRDAVLSGTNTQSTAPSGQSFTSPSGLSYEVID